MAEAEICKADLLLLRERLYPSAFSDLFIDMVYNVEERKAAVDKWRMTRHCMMPLASGGEDMPLDSEQSERSAKRGLLSRKLYLRILAILAIIGISASIFVFRDQVSNLKTYGYLGAFLIALVTSATIVLPVPGIVLIGALGAPPYNYDPVLIGLAAGAGSALGEITGYMAGYSGQVVFKNNRFYPRLERWMTRRGFIAIFVLSFVPNPFFDVAGATAGVLRYPLWKFLLACFVSKTLRYILVAWVGWFVAVSWF